MSEKDRTAVRESGYRAGQDGQNETEVCFGGIFALVKNAACVEDQFCFVFYVLQCFFFFLQAIYMTLKFIMVKTGHVFVPPGSVCNHGQGSHKEREEEEGDEDGLHLSCSA